MTSGSGPKGSGALPFILAGSAVATAFFLYKRYGHKHSPIVKKDGAKDAAKDHMEAAKDQAKDATKSVKDAAHDVRHADWGKKD